MLSAPSSYTAISVQPLLAFASACYRAGYWRWFTHDALSGQVPMNHVG